MAEMRGRMLVRARIAATDVPTGQAHSKVRPGTLAQFSTFLATARGKGLWLDGVAGLLLELVEESHAGSVVTSAGSHRGDCLPMVSVEEPVP